MPIYQLAYTLGPSAYFFVHGGAIPYRFNFPTFLEEDAFKKRVLVPKHQAFVCGASVALMKSL